MGGALCSQLVQWREEICSCFKYTLVLYFLTPTTTNSPISPTIQFILHRFQGSAPQVCPHCRGQSQMGCSSYRHFCPTTSSGIPLDPLLRVDNFTRMAHIHSGWTKKMGSMYTKEYDSAIRKDEFLPLTLTWTELECIILSETQQSEKDKYMVSALGRL